MFSVCFDRCTVNLPKISRLGEWAVINMGPPLNFDPTSSSEKGGSNKQSPNLDEAEWTIMELFFLTILDFLLKRKARLKDTKEAISRTHELQNDKDCRLSLASASSLNAHNGRSGLGSWICRITDRHNYSLL